MKVIKYEHQVDYFTSRIFEQYFGGMSFCVFDIETLGLHPTYDQLVLAGIMTVEPDGKCCLTQYFLEHLEEEVYMLAVLQDELNKYDFVLTYNGRHFDVPFIKKRAEVLGLENYNIDPYNLDLYLIINGHSYFRYMLENLRQSTVEIYMGLETGRDDMISGKESVQLYLDFSVCKDSVRKDFIRNQILLHNHDDILQLYRILPVLLQTDMHSAMNSLGFPIKGENGWPDMFVRVCRATSQAMTITGLYTGDPFSYTSYSTHNNPFQCEFTYEGSFTFIYPVQNFKGNLFINIKELLGENSELEKLPGYVNGFMVLAQKNKRNFLEINMVSKELLKKFMNDTDAQNAF